MTGHLTGCVGADPPNLLTFARPHPYLIRAFFCVKQKNCVTPAITYNPTNKNSDGSDHFEVLFSLTATRACQLIYDEFLTPFLPT